MEEIKRWIFTSENLAVKGFLSLKIQKIGDALTGDVWLDNIHLTNVIAFSVEELLKRADSNLDMFYKHMVSSIGI